MENQVSNTEWREFFSILQQKVGTPVEVAYVSDNKKFTICFPPPMYLLENDYIKDPGLGAGPTYYKEIHTVRIPLQGGYKNPKTGAVNISEKASRELLNELDKLDPLPVEVTEEFIIISGYEKQK